MSDPTLFYFFESVFVVLGLFCFLIGTKRITALLWLSLVFGAMTWCGLRLIAMVHTLMVYSRTPETFFPTPPLILLNVLWDFIPIKIWWLQYPSLLGADFPWFDTVLQSAFSTAGLVLVILSIRAILVKQQMLSDHVVKGIMILKAALKSSALNYPIWLGYTLIFLLVNGLLQAFATVTQNSFPSNSIEKKLILDLSVSAVSLIIMSLYVSSGVHFSLGHGLDAGRTGVRNIGKVSSVRGWPAVFAWTLLWICCFGFPPLLYVAMRTAQWMQINTVTVGLYFLYVLCCGFVYVKTSLAIYFVFDDHTTLLKAVRQSWLCSQRSFWDLLLVQLFVIIFVFVSVLPALMAVLMALASQRALNQASLWIIAGNLMLMVLLIPLIQGTKLSYLARIKRVCI